jgi:hypothetical protein
MSLLSDWNDYEGELEGAINAAEKKKLNPPKEVLVLLKTDDLKKALTLADQAEKKGNIDDARSAQGKSQKFFFKYANQFKAAKKAVKEDDTLGDLDEFLMMFNVYMTRTQKAVAELAAQMIKEAKEATDDDKKRLELDIKSALSPLKFKADWKAGKEDFEAETGQKKPSETILGAFNKATSVEAALGHMDDACKKADPKAYRKAFAEYVAASSKYESLLWKALESDKAADAVYKRKCEGLKELLGSIESRGKEKLKLLEKLGV